MKYQSRILDNQAQPKDDIYTSSSTQKFALGTIFKMDDGRVFRYAKAGAVALAKGKMAQSPALTAAYTSVSSLLKSKSTAMDIVTVSLTSVTAAITQNQFQDGLLIVHGDGRLRKVKSHAALGTTTSTATLAINLVDALTGTLAGTEKVSLTANPFNGAIVVPNSGASGNVIGVPLVTIAAGEFGWLQVRGEAPLLIDTGDTPAVGDWVGEPKTYAVAGAAGVIGAGASATDTIAASSITIATNATKVPIPKKTISVDTDQNPAWGRVIATAGADSYAIVHLCVE